MRQPLLWLGPLGRYRPGVFRKHLAHGFKSAGGWGTVGRLPVWWPHWSSPEEKLLERLDLDGKVVYDVGAFAGAYSLYFSRRVGAAGSVVAFEPQLENFSKLIRNLNLNRASNVQALALALGAASESRPIYRLPGMATTASLAPAANTPFRVRAGMAHIVRLDDLVAAMNLPPPGFVKVDVEGLEIEVIQGALEILARHHPSLLVEIHGASRGEKAARLRHLAALLEPLGYALTHAESGMHVTSGAPSSPAAGHLFAEAV